MSVVKSRIPLTGTEGAAVVVAVPGEPVVLPRGFALVDAAFHRDGMDLVLVAPDGRQVIVRGFYSGDTLPTLRGADGAQISGEIAATMAGPQTPGQVALAEAEALAGEPIGQVNTVSGRAFINRTDGTRIEAEIDQPLYKGDVLETEEDGAIGVVLADETTFSMGGDGRMVLDEMIYDPATQEGALSLFVVKGVYTFVSGLVSKTDPDGMVIDLPVGTIGIRGTQLGIEFTDGQNLTAVMMREADGYVGEVVLSNPFGSVVMNQANQVVFAGAGDVPPEPRASVDDADIVDMFGTTLQHLPSVYGQENDYNTQAAEGGGELEEFTTEGGEAEEAPTVDETIRVIAGDYTEAPEAPVAAPVLEAETPSAAEEPEAEEAVTPTRRADLAPAAEMPLPTVEDLGVVSDYPPVAFDATAATAEDQSVSGQLYATDVDNDALTFALDASPERGSVVVNADGTYTYTPDPDYYGIDTFSYVVSDGQGGETTATVTIEIEPVPETPILTVSAASGAEDTAIPLGVAAEVAGNEAIASLGVANLPGGATLSAGTDNGDGTWTLLPGDLVGLILTPPDDFSGDLDLLVTAYSTDGGAANASLGVVVAPVPDLPVVTVQAVSGAEDTAIPLSVAADVPGAEEVALVTISSVPEGASLSAGDDNGDGSWTLLPADLDGLMLTPPPDSTADIDLSVEAVSTDGGTASAGFTVAVTAVPDLPVLTVQAAAGVEDAAIPLTITAEVPGAEDVASVTIGGVPEGATLSAGTDNGDGTWSLLPDDLIGLTLTPPADVSGTFELTVNAVSTDGGTADAGFSVAVTAVPDVPMLSVRGARGDEDTAIPLAIAAEVPGTEQLASVVVAGVPQGAMLSAGTDNGDGTWTLLPADLDGLTITPPPESHVDFGLSVMAISTDGGTASAGLQVSVAAVAEAPQLEVSDIAVGGEGPPGDDIVIGTRGEDVLYGGGGDDLVVGWTGADVIYGDSGTAGEASVVALDIMASLEGAEPTDTLSVSVGNVPEGASLSAGTDQGDGTWVLSADDLDGLTLTLPEGQTGEFRLSVQATETETDPDTGETATATTSAAINVTYGGAEAGDDILIGGRGDDVIHGEAGDDALFGDRGEDVLYGGAGDDALFGGRGADVIHGGRGDDVLRGGSGVDTFVFEADGGADVIEDFRLDEVLRFEGPEFGGSKPEVTSNGDGTVRIAFSEQNVEVTVDNVDLEQQGYTVTEDGDSVVVTFHDLE